MTTTAPAKKAVAKRPPAAKKTTVKKTAASVPAPSTSSDADPQRTQLQDLPADWLEPNLDNVRREVVDDEGLAQLADSIDEQGVLEPLIVHAHPEDPGKYVIIAGHRRHAAASKLDPKFPLPCLIRKPYATKADLIAAMLVENSQRSDLSPIEEAAAFETMHLEGLSDDDIAGKIGRDKRLVVSRRKLLKLDDDRQLKVHARQLTLGQAEAMVEFRTDERALRALEEAADGTGYHSFDDVLRTVKAAREAEKTSAAVRKRLKEEGRTLSERDPGWKLRLGQGPIPANVEAHDATACKHLVAYVGYNGNVHWFCLDPTQHGAQLEGQTDAVAEAENLAVQRQRDADEEQRLVADLGRRDFLQDRILGRAELTLLQADAVQRQALQMHFAYSKYIEIEYACQLLAADELGDRYVTWMGTSGVGGGRDYAVRTEIEIAVKELIFKLPPTRAWLLALAMFFDADSDLDVWCEPDELTGSRFLGWIEFLDTELGYELTEWEAARIAEAKAWVAEEDEDAAAVDGALLESPVKVKDGDEVL